MPCLAYDWKPFKSNLTFESATYACWATCPFCLLKNLQIFVDWHLLESADMDFYGLLKLMLYFYGYKYSVDNFIWYLDNQIPQVYNDKIGTTLNRLESLFGTFEHSCCHSLQIIASTFEKKKYKLPPTQLTQGQTGFLHVSFWFLLKKKILKIIFLFWTLNLLATKKDMFCLIPCVPIFFLIYKYQLHSNFSDIDF